MPWTLSSVNSSFRGSGPSRAMPGTSVGPLDQVDGEALLGARLGHVETGSVVEDETCGWRALSGARRRWLRAVVPPHPANTGEVHDQVEVADRKVEELAVPVH